MFGMCNLSEYKNNALAVDAHGHPWRHAQVRGLHGLQKQPERVQQSVVCRVEDSAAAARRAARRGGLVQERELRRGDEAVHADPAGLGARDSGRQGCVY